MEAIVLKYLGVNKILNDTSSTKLDIHNKSTQCLTPYIATWGTSATTKAKVYDEYVVTVI